MSNICPRVSDLWFRSCHLYTRDDGARFFVKAGSAEIAAELAAERAALEVLAGLAVPDAWEDAAGRSVEHLGGIADEWLARDFAPGKPLHAFAFRPAVALGVWGFVVEQLAAFRRRGVLLSDVKTDNVIFDRATPSCVLIDFGGAVPVAEGPRFPATRLAWTPGAVAPEHLAGGVIGETALVFQAGVLLSHLLAGVGALAIAERLAQDDFLTSACGFGDKILPEAVSHLLRECLDEDPKLRPPTYAALHERLDDLPPEASAVWDVLREPYAEQLGEVLA
jgi:serine/threonine protein kinase